MRTLHYILLVLVAMTTMVACTSDVYEQELEGHQLITFPVVLSTTQQRDGTGQELVPPTCIYIWAVLNMKAETDSTASTYLFHRRVDNGTWDQITTAAGNGTADSVNTLSMRIILDVGASKRFRIPVGEKPSQDGSFTVGYIYALAGKFDIEDLLPASMTDSIQLIGEGMSQALAMIEEMTIDLTQLQQSMAQGVEQEGLPQGEQGFSQFLSTLYSTPSALRLESAQVVSGSNNFYVLQSAPQLQLAPCATPVHVSWDLTQMDKNKMSSIELHDLPSRLRLFDPAHNPQDSTYQCLMLSSNLGEGVNTLAPDSRYSGQTSAHVLQPASGRIPYTVRLSNGLSRSGIATRTQDGRYTINVKE